MGLAGLSSLGRVQVLETWGPMILLVALDLGPVCVMVRVSDVLSLGLVAPSFQFQHQNLSLTS